jgi:membrane-associated phospholipid phosphatase
MLRAKQKTSPLDLASWNTAVLKATLAEWLLPSRTLQRRLWPLTVGAAYIALIAVMGGLRSDHVWMGMLALLDFYNEKSRQFLKYFFPFMLTGVVYDFMRYFYWQGIEGHIRVAEPYYRDLSWFGVPAFDGGPARRVTPNEFFAIHHWTILDIFCGFAYLVYITEYLLAAFYLFFRKKWELLTTFGWVFFIVNVLGFITYFIYPAAPPWYVAQYGLGPALMNVHPNQAAAARFDQFFGTHFFDGLYGRGVDVYGAYPSLHVTYPLLVSWVCFQVSELKWVRPFAVAFFFLMCLSAVYLQHHYIVDILLGVSYAITTLCIVLRVRQTVQARASTVLAQETLR